jgi:hypothetical protein
MGNSHFVLMENTNADSKQYYFTAYWLENITGKHLAVENT